ncbi:uncharacterized protein LOC116256784 isoform X2 [Nymphaea colorata]|nr:uncharacterized protein LOC116256784 isoform X2 [Nymphaea colorata]XP_031489165.1 uncharacterized protein LOC116256784 isoform X2 [Nymphaea colorata]
MEANEGLNAHTCKGGDINMEAPILMDDLILAGGLGATDDIGSAFPAAVDFTDFEESLCYARGYEELEVDESGTGLGSNICKSGDINMEAPISMDDLIRAGGLGATDDIGCAIPGSVDCTNVEAAHGYSEEYEEPREDEYVCQGDEPSLESALSSDDLVRAGGFGAKDDLSSFLPAAIDSTDFEASLRDARDYEEPQGEVSRPGLGWLDGHASDTY